MKDPKDPKTRIPYIRAQLFQIADEFHGSALARRLRKLANATLRRSPAKPRAKAKYPKMTEPVAKKVVAYWRKNEELGYFDLAKVFNTNQGRIADAFRMMGVRFDH